MVEALAFFCSRVIDPRRTARTADDWREVIKRFERKRKLGEVQKRDLATARRFVEHKEYEKQVLRKRDFGKTPPGLYGLPRALHVSVTRALGRRLGGLLYEAVTEDRVGRPLIVEAMKDDVRQPDKCRDRYFQLFRLCTQRVSGSEEE
jgi:hypothetical protein